jgi:ribosomal protein L37AE/L43A
MTNVAPNFPPPNYILDASEIDGIEVYKPASLDQIEHQTLVEFKCPSCGAETAYSISEGGLSCSHCGYLEAQEHEISGRAAPEYEFTLETIGLASQGWDTERVEMECQSCGVKTSLPIELKTHQCAYCGSNQVIQREDPQEVLRPRFLVPFEIDHEKCQQIAKKWLGSSWMTPRDLKNIKNIERFRGIYLPYWTFDATADANWKAEVGHTKTKRYYSNGKWKKRVVIEWRWEEGTVNLNFNDQIIPGSKRLSMRLLKAVGNWQLSKLTSYEAKFLAGLQAQAYDISLDNAWELARAEMRENTRQASIDQASTHRVRNFRMQLDFADEKWRYILLPVHIANYSYRGSSYQVIINGQGGTITGQRPVDWGKVWLVIAAILSPGFLLCLVGVITVLLGGVGIIIGGLGFIFLVIGIVIAIVIGMKAAEMDDI